MLALLPLAAGCKKQLTPPELYETYCARCHGAQGEGDPRSLNLYPNLDLVRSPMVREGHRGVVRRRITEGYGPMPGFDHRLNEEEIEGLVDFTLALAKPRKAGE